MSITLYHSDPNTGEVFEQIEVQTDGEKEFRLSLAGGDWWETPRWKYNPRPHGLSNDNPFEAVQQNRQFKEFPKTLHKPMERVRVRFADPETKKTVLIVDYKAITKTVKDAQAQAEAEKQGWSEKATPLTPEQEAERYTEWTAQPPKTGKRSEAA